MAEGKDDRTVPVLLEEAEKIPGVAEVAELYGRLAPYTGVQVQFVTTTTRFDTGANPP